MTYGFRPLTIVALLGLACLASGYHLIRAGRRDLARPFLLAYVLCALTIATHIPPPSRPPEQP